MSDKLKRIWEARKQILEGVKNSIFPEAAIEEVAFQRMEICKTCPHFDTEGSGCMIPGTAPCCKLCGCSMFLKSRALSARCDAGKWDAILSPEEEDKLNENRNDQV